VNSPEESTYAEHEELKCNYRKEVEYIDEEIGNFVTESSAIAA